MTVDPETLQIVHYPHPVLRQRSDAIEQVDDHVRAVIDRMIALTELAGGIGLAANQVGLPWRLFICDVPAGDGRSVDDEPPTASPGPVVFVNPEVSEPAGPVEPFAEGCLSLPEITGDVRRPDEILVKALDRDGQPFTLRAAGLYGRCIQHEFDHIEGVLILDRMGMMDRRKNRNAIRALEGAGAG